MKSLKPLVAALIACATIHTASAVAVQSITVNSTGSLPAQIDFEGWADGPQAVAIPNGWLNYDGATIVQGVSNPQGASPMPLSGDYLSVTSNGWATFTFDTAINTFGFQWGSIDSYNVISFYNGATLLDTFTGDDIINPADGSQGATGSAYVVFGGELFDKITLTSVNINSFEIDNVSGSLNVPDSGATVALLGLGLIGLAAIRRKL